MTSPMRASDTPFAVMVEQSKRQPFCDGSHQNGPFNSVKYSATASHNRRV